MKKMNLGSLSFYGSVGIVVIAYFGIMMTGIIMEELWYILLWFFLFGVIILTTYYILSQILTAFWLNVFSLFIVTASIYYFKQSWIMTIIAATVVIIFYLQNEKFKDAKWFEAVTFLYAGTLSLLFSW